MADKNNPKKPDIQNQSPDQLKINQTEEQGISASTSPDSEINLKPGESGKASISKSGVKMDVEATLKKAGTAQISSSQTSQSSQATSSPSQSQSPKSAATKQENQTSPSEPSETPAPSDPTPDSQEAISQPPEDNPENSPASKPDIQEPTAESKATDDSTPDQSAPFQDIDKNTPPQSSPNQTKDSESNEDKNPEKEKDFEQGKEQPEVTSPSTPKQSKTGQDTLIQNPTGTTRSRMRNSEIRENKGKDDSGKKSKKGTDKQTADKGKWRKKIRKMKKAANLKQQAKQKAKKIAKIAIKRGATMAASAAASTVWIWGPILAILILIFLIVVILVPHLCSDKSWWIEKKIAGWTTGIDIASLCEGIPDVFEADPSTAPLAAPTAPTRPQQPNTAESETATDKALEDLNSQVPGDPFSVNSTARTSLDGLDQSMIDLLIALQAATGGDIVITGGTESGHSQNSNHNRGTAIDLRPNPSLDSVIISHGTRGPDIGGYPSYHLKIGGKNYRVIDERTNPKGSHWHLDTG